MQILRGENLKAFYILDIQGNKQVVQAVNNVDLEIEESEIYGIAGESGCGKSTLVKTLYGMIDPPLTLINGDIYYKVDEEVVSVFKLSEKELKNLRWKYISYIPQGSMNVLNPVIKIIDSFWDFIASHENVKGKSEWEKGIKEYLNLLGLPDKVLNAYPHQLSGGMRQRVIVALATVLNPKIIIADEPTTALDVVAQRGVLQLLKSIQSMLNNTIILVTHDMGVHAMISDRIGIMYAGNIIEEAKTEEIYENPLHPYTQYLIKSLPKIGDKSYKVSAPGAPPSLANPPSGCKFHPRCNLAMAECREKVPKFVEIEDRHKVACFLYSKEVDL
ncbi:MAG TPA: ABC transporter ATP-binding protein [Dictyoglomaceae bacterium]|nr:ABC transporter ATP-binding protein [Dictyoglomaceae bacterium]HPU43776.1 ABC transporter ATP-binding protein [Dictyoglomaceae bacterium]